MNRKLSLVCASVLVLLTTGCASSVSRNIGEAGVATTDARNKATGASQDASAVMLSVASVERIADAADKADRSAAENMRLANTKDWATFNTKLKADIDALKKQTQSALVITSDVAKR